MKFRSKTARTSSAISWENIYCDQVQLVCWRSHNSYFALHCTWHFEAKSKKKKPRRRTSKIAESERKIYLEKKKSCQNPNNRSFRFWGGPQYSVFLSWHLVLLEGLRQPLKTFSVLAQLADQNSHSVSYTILIRKFEADD